MPSSINSTSSSPGGLISTGDTDNELEIKTGDTTAISIDSSQNVTAEKQVGANDFYAASGFYVNSNTVTANYTLDNNNNAMSAGPITVDSGVTVTVDAGSRWVVI